MILTHNWLYFLYNNSFFQNFLIKNFREMFTENKSYNRTFYLKKHTYNIYLSPIVCELWLFIIFTRDLLFFYNSFLLPYFMLNYIKNIFLNKICQETDIWEVKGEYRTLQFACEKNVNLVITTLIHVKLYKKCIFK